MNNNPITRPPQYEQSKSAVRFDINSLKPEEKEIAWLLAERLVHGVKAKRASEFGMTQAFEVIGSLVEQGWIKLEFLEPAEVMTAEAG